jgi:phosphate acetyltransferase
MNTQGDILGKLVERARPLSRTVVFADALDPRTLRAASALSSAGVVRPVLAGPRSGILGLAREGKIDLAGVKIEDPATSEHFPALASAYAALAAETSPKTGAPAPEAALRDPLIFAGMMVRHGLAHGCVAGSVSKTSEVIRAALLTIGMRAGVRRVSSYFLMAFPDRLMSFADCAVQPEPGPGELAEIGTLAADNFFEITGIAPVVAFLSFSTRGSAEHPAVLKVREAADIFRRSRPDITSDGELQLDAAIDPVVAAAKAADSRVAGRANVLVFPDLNSGNIGYKIAQRLGGAVALGPILQGLARPAFDLSRGCSEEDIVMVAVINALSGG